MRPSLSKCFPNPLTHQWPSTSKPILCESQQLYVLVCICCCVPNTHLLVLQEKESTDMVTFMPKGPRYVDFRITARTTPEDISSFFLYAETASVSGVANNLLHSTAPQEAESADLPGPEFSPRSPRQSLPRGAEPATRAGSKTQRDDERLQPAELQSQKQWRQRQVVVVCLHGIMAASPAVLSVLTVVLSFGYVSHNRVTKMVPSLRIVAFCDHHMCAAVLPESIRACFALSTFLSGMVKDNAVILQSNNSKYSSIVNKYYMNEVIFSSAGSSLVETVTLTGAVSRYLRHLLEVVRGCLVMELASGPFIMRRVSKYITLLKTAAMLFMPNEEDLMRRTPGRWMSPRVQGLDVRANCFHVSLDTNANDSDLVSVNSSMVKPLSTLEHVVVSPTDVICLLPVFVTHHLTLRKSFVDRSAWMSAVRERMAGVGRPLSTDPIRLENALSSDLEQFKEDPAYMASLWDAHMASLALNNQRVTKEAEITSMTLNSTQLPGQSQTDGDCSRGLFGSGSRLPFTHKVPFQVRQESLIFPDAVMPSMKTKYQEAPLSSMNTQCRPVISTAPDSSCSGLLRNNALLISEYCNYCEVRDLVRAVIVCRSAPSPG
ncbi:unnamed protein product [Phytomonas sp. EM1]|nr:unnamed protein product [Phytomonas sp. EM1]|eukprot:CCW60141.1 unnamed protein product [Phytomonas sp. isolate EM1]